MNNLEREQIISQNPMLKYSSRNILLEDKDIIELYKHGESLEINGEVISIELLKKIIEDIDYYTFALKSLSKDFLFRIGTPRDSDITNVLHFERETIIEGINILLKRNIIPSSDKIKSRLEKLSNTASLSIDKIKNDYSGNYEVEIDDSNYSIPYDVLFIIMRLSEEELNDLINNKGIKEIYGIPKEILAKARITFINSLRFRNYSFFQDIKVSPELRKAIFEGMNDNYTILERAIYIYIKMCKILSYDDEYFVASEKDEVAQKHIYYSQLSKITPKNSKVVCCEFNILYARLLHELGIYFSEEYLKRLDKKYGLKHSNLHFTINEFPIVADSSKAFEDNDLANAKLNSNFDGFVCRSKDESIKRRFDETFDRVYKDIQEEEKRKKDGIHSFKDLKKRYAELTTNIKPVDLEERICVLIDTINSAGLLGLDAISYLNRIKENLFQDEQQIKNIRIAVIRSTETGDSNIYGIVNAIISINLEDFNNSPDKTTYYQYNPGEKLRRIEKDVLQKKCDNEIISVANTISTIPGINHRRYKEREK